MSRTFSSSRHEALVKFLKKKRKEAGLTQWDVAQRLRRYQSFITDYERGQKRIDAVELIEICEAIGISPHDALKVIVRKR